MDALDRLYWRLLETLRQAGAAPEGALTVAHLYQGLIPYRGVRAELGLLELAQYEHALLRLLSGERGYVVLEPAAAQEELRRELASPNPILGLYRDYADARIRIRKPRASVAATPAPPPAEAPSELAAPPPMSGAPQAEPVVPPAAQEAACSGCWQPLPRGREARFCPYCGTRQPERCCHCGAPLEEGWRFCIDCGEPRNASAEAAAGA